MTKKKYAEDLAKELDFTHDHEYFDYIIDSLINGKREQVRKLFNAMHGYDQARFLKGLDFTSGIHKSIHKSVLNLCIDELCK